MNPNRLAWMFVLLALSALSVNAQSILQIRGIVVDERNTPLPGAVVSVKTEGQNVVTGSEGDFSLVVKRNDRVKIEVSFLGYLSYSDSVSADSSERDIRIALQPDVQQLSEVIISDRYAEQRRKEHSQGIEVVGDEYIRQNLSGSLMKTLERLPGVTAMDIGSSQSKPVIRGLGFNRVVVTDHGVKHESQQWGADHGLEIDQYAVERAEVIKGPGSLRYGSDAIGGLIELNQVFIPQENSLGGSLNISGKSNNGLLGGSLELYGRNKEWYMTARVTGIDYADYKVPVDSVTINSYRVPLYRNRLRNTAGEDYIAHFSIGLIRKRFTTSVYVSDVFSKSGFFANAHGIMPLTTDSSYDLSNRDIQLPYQWVNHLKAISRMILFHGPWKTESEIGYQNNLRQELNQYIGHGYMPASLPDSIGFQSDLAREFRKNTFSLNIRTSRVLSVHTLSGGFNAEYQVNRIDGWAFIIPSFNQVTAGLFIIDEVRPNENLVIQAGIRYDLGAVDIQSYTDWFKTPVIADTDTTWQYARRAAALHRTFGSFSWSAGLSYSSSEITFKANIGRSFRMPIPKELAVNGVNYHYFIYEKGDPDLSPEVSYQFDAGLEWHIPKFAFEVSPFVNYFPNYIYLDPTYLHDYTYGAGNQIYQYTQSEVFRAGGELHMHYQLFRNLLAGLIAEYVYSRQLSGGKKGFTLPFSPPASMILNLKYTPRIGKTLINPYFSLDMNLTGPQNQIVPPEIKTPGYMDLSLSVGSEIKVGSQRWTVSLRIQNIMNSVYYNHTSFYRLMDVPEPGRNFSINILIPFEKVKKTNDLWVKQ
jgi:iron complex outermembrane receptor protein